MIDILTDRQDHELKIGPHDDLELCEVTTADRIIVVPLKQIKYISCDSEMDKN